MKNHRLIGGAVIALLLGGCASGGTEVRGGQASSRYESVSESRGAVEETIRRKEFDTEGRVSAETVTERKEGPVETDKKVSEATGRSPDITTRGDGKTKADTKGIELDTGPDHAKAKGGGLRFFGELVAKASVNVLYGAAAIMFFGAIFFFYRKRWVAGLAAIGTAIITVAVAVTAINSPWILILTALAAILVAGWVVIDFIRDRQRKLEEAKAGRDS